MSSEILRYEDTVFNLIQEYLDANQIFKFDKVFNYVKNFFTKSSLDLNDEGIKKVLVNLIDDKRIAEGSKLIRNDVLENLKRKKIHDFIIKNPGAYLNKIVTHTNYPISVVTWHLEMLFKFSFIKKEKYDNRNIFYEVNLAPEQARIYYTVSKEKSIKIIRFLMNEKTGASKKEMSDGMKMHPYTLNKYLEVLVKINVVKSVKTGRKLLFFSN